MLSSWWVEGPVQLCFHQLLWGNTVVDVEGEAQVPRNAPTQPRVAERDFEGLVRSFVNKDKILLQQKIMLQVSNMMVQVSYWSCVALKWWLEFEELISLGNSVKMKKKSL